MQKNNVQQNKKRKREVKNSEDDGYGKVKARCATMCESFRKEFDATKTTFQKLQKLMGILNENAEEDAEAKQLLASVQSDESSEQVNVMEAMKKVIDAFKANTGSNVFDNVREKASTASCFLPFASDKGEAEYISSVQKQLSCKNFDQDHAEALASIEKIFNTYFEKTKHMEVSKDSGVFHIPHRYVFYKYGSFDARLDKLKAKIHKAVTTQDQRLFAQHEQRRLASFDSVDCSISILEEVQFIAVSVSSLALCNEAEDSVDDSAEENDAAAQAQEAADKKTFYVPIDLWKHIIGYLPIEDTISNVRLVSKKFASTVHVMVKDSPSLNPFVITQALYPYCWFYLLILVLLHDDSVSNEATKKIVTRMFIQHKLEQANCKVKYTSKFAICKHITELAYKMYFQLIDETVVKNLMEKQKWLGNMVFSESMLHDVKFSSAAIQKIGLTKDKCIIKQCSVKIGSANMYKCAEQLICSHSYDMEETREAIEDKLLNAKAVKVNMLNVDGTVMKQPSFDIDEMRRKLFNRFCDDKENYSTPVVDQTPHLFQQWYTDNYLSHLNSNVICDECHLLFNYDKNHFVAIPSFFVLNKLYIYVYDTVPKNLKVKADLLFGIHLVGRSKQVETQFPINKFITLVGNRFHPFVSACSYLNEVEFRVLTGDATAASNVNNLEEFYKLVQAGQFYKADYQPWEFVQVQQE